MEAFAPRVRATPPTRPSQNGHIGPDSQMEREWDANWSDFESEISPTVMTIAMVGESDTWWEPADVLERVAELAGTDELVVVYGSDKPVSWPDAQPLVAGLRHLLPRHTVVVVYLPSDNALGRESAVLDELLELGILPIVVAPEVAASAIATELCGRLRADRLLSVSSTRVDESDVQRAGIGLEVGSERPISCTGSIGPHGGTWMA
jgi:hypothetical protein